MRPRRRLFYKYVVPIISIVVVALGASGAIGIYFSYKETRNALLALHKEKAVSAAQRIEQFVKEIEHQIGWTALPQIVEGANPLELRRFDYVKLGRQVQAITEAIYISAGGCLQVQTSRLAMDRLGECLEDLSRDPRYLGARGGKTWFGPVYFRKETEPYMAIAMRAGREGAGVTAVEVNLKFIWEVIQQIRIGRTGFAYVVNAQGHLVAHPDISLVLQKTDFSMLPQVKAAIALPSEAAGGHRGAEEARDRAGHAVLTAHARIEPLGWTVFVEQPISEAYQPLYAPLIRIGILLLLGLALSVLASLALARYMVRTINALREGAQAIGAGDLDYRIEVKTGDELQDLAEQFNKMASDLKESYAGLERKVEERTAELKQALEFQGASGEILSSISSSIANTQPVFEAIVRNITKLLGARYASVFIVRDGQIHLEAIEGDSDHKRLRESYPIPLDDRTSIGKAMLTGEALHYAPIAGNPEVPPLTREFARSYNFDSILSAPMLREGKVIGGISAAHAHSVPFDDKQVALIKVFAAQAVIAIENARLFNETKEALERQTATSEVLRVISRSPTSVQPVFQTIAERAARLCEAAYGLVFTYDGEWIRMGEVFGMDPHGVEAIRQRLPMRATGNSIAARTVRERAVVNIPDVLAEQEYEHKEAAEIAAFRGVLGVPMLKEGQIVGVITVARTDIGRFGEKQVDLLKTFADQAVIAIENVRLFHEIEEKSRQLEIANKHKSDFLANMSHELRTPLNAIIGFSEVLAERYFGELTEKQDEYVRDIHASGKHLLSLINDILDLSKIEAGRMELELADFDVPAALENALTLVKERAQRHGVALRLEIAPGIGVVRADERKFKQIMLNLLSNAVKFTPVGGAVGVSARVNGEAIEIAVADTGVGIAPEDHEAVFEEFRQVGRDVSKKAEGTGLGLALTKRFIELHGGRIRLDSAPGKGSTFTFTLPMRHGQ